MDMLQVFALDSDRNRLTGSIPYTSLIWDRKYYEPGEFSMSVLSDVYSPDWAYICAWGRTELAMVQKVEVDDSVNPGPYGKDVITISGFFLEQSLNDLVFLIEQTEQEEYRIYKPAKVSTRAPTVKRAPDGKLYIEQTSFDGSKHYRDVETGIFNSAVDGSSLTDVSVTPGYGMQHVPYSDTYMSSNYDSYSEDGKTLVTVTPGGAKNEYELVSKPTGIGYNYGGTTSGTVTLYKDHDGNIRWTTGVTTSSSGGYKRKVQEWERQTEGLEKVTSGGDTYAIAYREVKGPWQLRTDVGDVGKEIDNVQQVIEWAQLCFGNTMQYDEPGFEGVAKVIDPSLKRVGDLFFEELKTVEASVRLLYDFEQDVVVFSAWRGLDRTQDQDTTVVVPDPILPSGYTQLDYIESTGTQYINTGFTPNQNTRVMCGFEYLGSRPADHAVLFGSRVNWSGDQQYYFGYNGGWRSDYGDGRATYSESEVPFSGRHVIDKNKGETTLDGQVKSSPAITATMPGPMYVFAGNTNGTAAGFIKARISRLKAYAADQLKRDLYPARRDSDGAVGMYDMVEGLFYGNSGSGAFVAGPDAEVPSHTEQGNANPFAVFSDTWGTLYDYRASVDKSNYKNKCYVLYDYYEPEWDENGHPVVETVREYDGEKTTTYYHIPQAHLRGYETVRLDDDREDSETWVDMRKEGPEGADDLPDPGDRLTEAPDVSGITKAAWDAFKKSITERGNQTLTNDYCVINSLDTGTLAQDDYLDGWDLGDKVDYAVDRIGMVGTGRIIEVIESYEAGKPNIRPIMGEEAITMAKKQAMN